VVQFGYDQTKMSQNYTEVIFGEIILKQYLALELCTPNNINDSKPYRWKIPQELNFQTMLKLNQPQ
jgi:hypothetical protein